MSILDQLAKQVTAQKDPPVESWSPPYCGEIDIRIDRAGHWYHEGTVISRLPLIRLFASILVREADDFFLVTPVEKVKINVEATPFVIVGAERINQEFVFKTNLDFTFVLSKQHPLLFNDENEPTVIVKRNLPARLLPTVMYQLQMYALENDGLRDDGLYLVSGEYECMLEAV